jgi:hypothetical protein
MLKRGMLGMGPRLNFQHSVIAFPGGFIPGVHNPFMGPAIRFEPGTKPVFVPAAEPIL